MRGAGTRRVQHRRIAAASALALGVVAVLLVVQAASGPSHTLRAAFASAVDAVPGNQVRIAGRTVGSVQSVTLSDGQAVLELAIDRSAWPLHQRTLAALRYDGPSSYALRYVELEPGPRSAPALADGAVLSSADTLTPVEFDQIYRIFDPPTRHNFQALLANASATLTGRGGQLGGALAGGADGFQALAGLMSDLGYDPAALRTLISSGAQASGQLAGRERELEGLVANAASTFQEWAGHAGDQRAALERFPQALDTGRQTLAHVAETLPAVSRLVGVLRPGAGALRRVAPRLGATLGTLLRVAPLATSTLDAGTRAAPAIARFFSAGTPFMPELARALGTLAPMVACVRPYGPELAGMAVTWGGFESNYDHFGHYGVASEQKSLIPVGTSLNSKQLTTQFKDRLFYAMPRPPGLNAGKPWFIPSCGYGPSALDPSKDPENQQ